MEAGEKIIKEEVIFQGEVEFGGRLQFGEIKYRWVFLWRALTASLVTVFGDGLVTVRDDGLVMGLIIRKREVNFYPFTHLLGWGRRKTGLAVLPLRERVVWLVALKKEF